MFIINPITKEEATGELKLLYRMIEKQLGFIPPHFAMMATIDIEAMKEFLNYNVAIMNHPKIDKGLMPFLRLYIARKECRRYCTTFNQELLAKQGIEQKIIDGFQDDLDLIPFDKSQKLLLEKVFKAIYDSEAFNRMDLEALYAQDFSDKDLFDILGYATGFMGKSKMIEAYLA